MKCGRRLHMGGGETLEEVRRGPAQEVRRGPAEEVRRGPSEEVRCMILGERLPRIWGKCGVFTRAELCRKGQWDCGWGGCRAAKCHKHFQEPNCTSYFSKQKPKCALLHFHLLLPGFHFECMCPCVATVPTDGAVNTFPTYFPNLHRSLTLIHKSTTKRLLRNRKEGVCA